MTQLAERIADQLTERRARELFEVRAETYTMRDAAELLGCSEATVSRLVHQGLPRPVPGIRDVRISGIELKHDAAAERQRCQERRRGYAMGGRTSAAPPGDGSAAQALRGTLLRDRA